MITFLDRIGRPVFIRIMLPCALVWFGWEIVKRLLALIDRAIETGEPVPDVTAGLMPLAVVIVPIFGNIIMDQWTRARQRQTELERGQAPGPFGGGSSRPLPPEPDPENWPRPGGHHQ